MQTDPPRHGEIRDVLMKALRPSLVCGVRARIAEIADEFLMASAQIVMPSIDPNRDPAEIEHPAPGRGLPRACGHGVAAPWAMSGSM